MFMSVLDTSLTSASYTELAGARIVLTGLVPTCGVDIARAFADARVRLVLQTAAVSSDPEVTEIVALLAETAQEIKLFDGALTASMDVTRFAQAGCQAFGGVDTMVNMVAITAADIEAVSKSADVEVAIARLFEPMFAMTRICANRMRLTMTEGGIVNIALVEQGHTAHAGLITAMIKVTLAAMTRVEAQTWAKDGIRINAIGPRATMAGDKDPAVTASEPEVAAIALYLASSRARGLSGHVFQAEGALTKCS